MEHNRDVATKSLTTHLKLRCTVRMEGTQHGRWWRQ